MVARRLYCITCMILPILYIILSARDLNIVNVMQWSSIVMTAFGAILIFSYNGPSGSNLGAALLGRPPRMVRFLTTLNGAMALAMIFIFRNN